MPRTSRSVAQRLATQTKSKKRRPSRTGASSPEPASPPASGPTMAEILDEVVPSSGGSRAESRADVAPTTPGQTPNRPPAATRRGVAARAARPVVVRRRYHEYGAEYGYVWTDLRRILIVAVVLIALLVILSFVLNQ